MNATFIGAIGIITDINKYISHLEQVSKRYQIELQIINAAYVYGKDHLQSAVTHAQRAFKQKRNSCKTLAMEIMLYASGERQIQKALPKIGIAQTTKEFAIIILHKKKIDINKLKKEIADTTNLLFTDAVLGGSKETINRWGFTQKEMQTVPEYKYGDLILEKVALVDVIKK